MGAKRGILFFGGGCLAGVLATALWWSPGQPAQAQPAGGGGRFQISSFTIPQGSGAYVVDTQTGDVYQVVGRGDPEHIGSVGKPPKK